MSNLEDIIDLPANLEVKRALAVKIDFIGNNSAIKKSQNKKFYFQRLGGRPSKKGISFQ